MILTSKDYLSASELGKTFAMRVSALRSRHTHREGGQMSSARSARRIAHKLALVIADASMGASSRSSTCPSAANRAREVVAAFIQPCRSIRHHKIDEPTMMSRQ